MSKGAWWVVSGIRLGCFQGAFLCNSYVQLGVDSRVDPELAVGNLSFIWPRNVLESPRSSWKVFRETGIPGIPRLADCHSDLTPDKQTRMDGWWMTWMPWHVAFVFLKNSSFFVKSKNSRSGADLHQFLFQPFDGPMTFPRAHPPASAAPVILLQLHFID